MKSIYTSLGRFIIYAGVGALFIIIKTNDRETTTALKQAETIEKQPPETTETIKKHEATKLDTLIAKAASLKLKREQLMEDRKRRRYESDDTIPIFFSIVVFVIGAVVVWNYDPRQKESAPRKKKRDWYLLNGNGHMVKDVIAKTGDDGEEQQWQQLVDNDSKMQIVDGRDEVLRDQDVHSIIEWLDKDPATYTLNEIAAQKAKRLWARGLGTKRVAKHFKPEEKFGETMCKACVTVFNKYHNQKSG